MEKVDLSIYNNQIFVYYLNREESNNYYNSFIFTLQEEKLLSKNAKIVKDNYNKPYILDNGKLYNFSISKTEKQIYFAIISNFKKENLPIGIDFESKQPSNKLLKKIATKEEIEKKIDIKNLWTFKEALSKIYGTGLAIGFKNLNIFNTTTTIFNKQYKILYKHIKLNNEHGTIVFLNK